MTSFNRFMQRTHFWLDERPQFLLRATIIAVVLLISLYSAYLAATATKIKLIFYNPVLMLTIGAIAAVVFIRWPKLGLIVLVPSLILVVLDIGTGSETNIGLPILLAGLLIGLWFFDMVARQRSIQLFHSPTLVPILAFLVTSLIALGFGQLPWFAGYHHAPFRAQIGEVGIYVISFATFLWVGHNLSDLKTLKIAMFLFFGAAVVLMLGEYSGTLANLTSKVVHYAIRGGSMFWIWLSALAFSQVILNKKLNIYGRIALIVILISAAYISFIKYQGWTSGWLPPLVSMVVILWFGVPKLRKPLIIVGLLSSILLWQKIYSVLMAGDNAYSLSTRLAAWQIIAKIVPVDPLFGLGPANYYWYTPLFSIAGYRVVFNSHNNYVDLIAQLGIVGIACFFWFAWAMLRVIWRLRNVVQDDFARAFVYGVLGGWVASLVACMFGDWLLPFVYNIGYAGLRASLIGWFFLGGVLYLERIHSADQAALPAGNG